MTRLGFTLFVLLQATSPAWAADLVRLSGFESEASTFANRATGRTSFRLFVAAGWTKHAPRDATSYLVSMTLPDGRSVLTPLAASDGPGSSRITIDVPAESVRNLAPDAVKVAIQVVGKTHSQPVSNILEATIRDFPRPVSNGPYLDLGPFGGGKPLDGPATEARPLPKPGPDGQTFIRIPSRPALPGFYLATRETTNRQFKSRIKDYDPRAGRSDEFALENPEQPALNLTPEQARTYLQALSTSEGLGVIYRLPSVAEWTLAANAGRTTAYWWGDQASFPEGANLLGPEPGLAGDTTAARSGFIANPWGLFHTYGNVEEWATSADGTLVRLGGHFRTEPSTTPGAAKLDNGKADPYVGVRVAFSLTSVAGAELIRAQLATIPGLRNLAAEFDPDRGLVTIKGQADDSSTRRLADQKAGQLWFVAAINNQITTPSLPPRALAVLGKVAGLAHKSRPLGRREHRIPIEVRYAEPLPVSGSDWFANVYLPGGRHLAHRLFSGEPGSSRRVTVALDLANLDQAATTPIMIALSLGKPAPRIDDPHIVSNIAFFDWSPASEILRARKE